MITFIETEFLKLKRSKIFFITILGALFVPFMLSMGIAYELWQSPDYIFYFKEVFEEMKLFLFLLFGVEVFAIVSAYLFGREYSERTLKSILTTPISKIKYLCGKFLMFFIWTILLVLISYFGLILFGEVIGIKGLTFGIFSETLTSYLYNGVLLFLTMTPFAFFAIWIKSLVPSMIAGGVVTVGSVMIYGRDLNPLFPWTGSFVLANGEISQYAYSEATTFGIILAVFIIGFVLSYIYLYKTDTPL